MTRADYFDAELTRPIPDGVSAADTETHFITAGLSASDFDPDSKSTYSDEWLVGAEYEWFPGVNFGINYTRRSFGRVLEDVGTAPMAAYFLDIPGLDSVEYFITNPDPGTPTVTDLDASFEEAIHEYDALTFTAEKRFGTTWGLQASYRYAQLEGTFEGFFRNDNEARCPLPHRRRGSTIVLSRRRCVYRLCDEARHSKRTPATPRDRATGWSAPAGSTSSSPARTTAA